LVQIVVADNAPPFFAGADDPDLQRLRPYGEITLHERRSADRAEFLRRVAAATALIYVRRPSPLDEEAFSQAPDLKVVCFPGVGGDGIDFAAARRHAIAVCNLPGANAPAVAEHTLGLIFAIVRSIALGDRSMREGRWEKHEGFELGGKVLGLLGLGAIGGEMARLGRGLGMQVIAWSYTHDRDRASRLGVELVELDAVFERSDVVSVHLKGSPDVAGLVGQRQFGLMKPAAVFVNTARAVIVDEGALLHVLRERCIAGAAMDVYSQEPMTLEANPFRELDNVVMTPHMADETRETNARMRARVVDNVIAFLEGRPQNVVN
jgi:phosphoglycerate dehydrogenase-like enzyme